MGKFNNSSTVASPKKQKQIPNTINQAGGLAFTLDDQLQLVALLAASFTQQQAYSSGSDQIQRMVELGKKVDPLFAAKAAIYARDKMNMRSITHVLAATIGSVAKGLPWTKNFFDKIVVRPDDMIEIIGFSKSHFGKHLPAAMKKGFAKAFSRFDDYRLRKYRGTGSLTLVDVARLVHPKGIDGSPVHKLIYDKLPLADTWETKVSAAGSDASAKTDAWADLLKEKKLGYMALLRNLRNILNTGDGGLIGLACEQLIDPGRIAKSRLLPFRFYSAFRELSNEPNSRLVIDAISKACDISLGNLTAQFEGSTLVAVDTSGSMGQPVGGGKLSCMEAGLLFGSAVYKAIPDSDIMIWADDSRTVNQISDMPVIGLTQGLLGHSSGVVGHGTNIDSIFQRATKKYDRICIMTDMQSWRHKGTASFEHYKREFKANPWIHWFDLSGAGSAVLPVDGSKCSFIPGFSDKVIDLLAKVEEDPRAMITEIEAIEL